MLIVIEGCDGVGKTTLVEMLVEALANSESSLVVEHRGVPERSVHDEYVGSIDHYQAGQGADVVCDRWHWGELVYGPLYRGKSLLGRPGRKIVDDALITRGAIIVYMTQDRDTLYERLYREEGRETYLRREDVADVLQRYEAVAAESAVPVVELRDPTPSDVQWLLLFAQSVEYFAAKRTWTK